MRIGIDFDNTIVRYDGVFESAARKRGLLPDSWSASGKTAVRDHLRRQPDGERLWQGLQGWVYGHGIEGAEPFPGLYEFLAACRDRAAMVAVVSHKTQHGHQDPERVDLRAAARGWLTANGLLGPNSVLSSDSVFFEETLDAKVERIGALGLDVFIDDLPEVFTHPRFPRNVAGILFGEAICQRALDVRRLSTWDEIRREVIG